MSNVMLIIDRCFRRCRGGRIYLTEAPANEAVMETNNNEKRKASRFLKTYYGGNEIINDICEREYKYKTMKKPNVSIKEKFYSRK